MKVTWIRILNSVFGVSIRVLALVCVRSKWHLLLIQLRNKTQSTDYLDCHNLGFLPAALIACEDARFLEHNGVDFYSIIRATVRLLLKHSVEGASTITQQLVRVYTRDYRFSLHRKMVEVLLATLVDRHFSKEDQIRLYLIRAYFGWRMNGLTQATHRLQYTRPYSIEQAAEIAARLKYPEPEVCSIKRRQQIDKRVKHVMEMLSHLR